MEKIIIDFSKYSEDEIDKITINIRNRQYVEFNKGITIKEQ